MLGPPPAGRAVPRALSAPPIPLDGPEPSDRGTRASTCLPGIESAVDFRSISPGPDRCPRYGWERSAASGKLMPSHPPCDYATPLVPDVNEVRLKQPWLLRHH